MYNLTLLENKLTVCYYIGAAHFLVGKKHIKEPLSYRKSLVLTRCMAKNILAAKQCKEMRHVCKQVKKVNCGSHAVQLPLAHSRTVSGGVKSTKD